MSPSNHHYRRNRRRPPPTLARPSKYRTICDLPVELLCMIVSHVKSSRWTLRACTLACHCLRAVSLEHYFNTRLKVRDIRSFDHLISFLRAAPNIREKIRRLELSGQTEIGKVPHIALTSIDDTVVATLMQLLPNLTSLDINSMMYDTPASRSPPHVQQDKPGPFRLQSFSFDFYYTLSHNSSISGLFRILSLFSIDALSYSVRDFDTTSPFDLAFLHRPLEIKKLRISHCSPDENSGTSLLLDAFTESLEPESLESLRIEYGTGPEVLALGKLLARAGKALTSLSISGIHPFMLSERKPWHWVDPLNSMSMF
ncbi:hypothetical protein DICSQDRAFT_126907 [Dichomitus squalens LYAD-421 SS1]|uniref:F-box domain-containing protein n=1 Tax=Dichomitus squalens (strain LYAD-421) TaxID=732165 RepID=R7T1I2_DICSQ|nr:uncharacterized protein DICSQDRAFT_126907 [Dichomitus squalens LYAD-421 SS1]EJF61825.1 hypothetical protein DICSQDRAFT_126907 [Dichomitus squalens LYAD-421 SS1]